MICSYIHTRACFILLYYFINPNIPFNVSIPNYLKQRKSAYPYTYIYIYIYIYMCIYVCIHLSMVITRIQTHMLPSSLIKGSFVWIFRGYLWRGRVRKLF
jgi:hypothetical protein